LILYFKWFDGFKWESLEKGTLASPFSIDSSDCNFKLEDMDDILEESDE
jgi:hypothetical protein